MNLGIVGNGMIVNMFLEEALEVEGAKPVAICVRPQSVEKGKALYRKQQGSKRTGLFSKGKASVFMGGLYQSIYTTL